IWGSYAGAELAERHAYTESTLYLSASGEASFSPILPWMSRSWLVTFWPICKERECRWTTVLFTTNGWEKHLTRNQAPDSKSLIIFSNCALVLRASRTGCPDPNGLIRSGLPDEHRASDHP